MAVEEGGQKGQKGQKGQWVLKTTLKWDLNAI